MYREHAKFGLGAQSINLTSLNIYTDSVRIFDRITNVAIRVNTSNIHGNIRGGRLRQDLKRDITKKRNKFKFSSSRRAREISAFVARIVFI